MGSGDYNQTNDAEPLMADEFRQGEVDTTGALGLSLTDSTPLDGVGFGGKYSGFIVLIAVVAVAGGALWGMRQMGMSGNISLAGDLVIDEDIDAITARVENSDHGEILSELEASNDKPVVPLDDVEQNPFAWEGLIKVAEATPFQRQPVIDPEEEARRRREARARELETTFGRLRLNSVLGGTVPVARISGEMVRVGDTIGEHFEVTAIGGRSVDLVADGRTFILKLEDR